MGGAHVRISAKLCDASILGIIVTVSVFEGGGHLSGVGSRGDTLQYHLLCKPKAELETKAKRDAPKEC